MSYRLLSFEKGGVARAGLAVGERVFDAADATGLQRYDGLLAILLDWEVAEPALRQAAQRAQAGLLDQPSTSLEEVRLLAPLPGSTTIFGAGANYQDHVEEMARVLSQPVGLNAKQQGESPFHFVKTGRNALVGPGADVAMPGYSVRVDHEIELAAVIGRAARNVKVEEALAHVAGYTIANDLSAREVGRPLTPQGSPFHYDWITMKCFDGACPLGPWIVPAAQVGDPQRLAMKLWVNGVLMQDSSTDRMIFSVAEQIAWLSTRLTLQPGDLILTGSPAGVGVPHGRFLKAGDTVSLWIERIGEMSHRMVEAVDVSCTSKKN